MALPTRVEPGEPHKLSYSRLLTTACLEDPKIRVWDQTPCLNPKPLLPGQRTPWVHLGERYR